MNPTTVGIDVGQRRDPTALCIAQAERRKDDDVWRVHFQVRNLQRLPLGTPYPEIATRLAKVVEQVEDRTNRTPLIYVDATGVGKPLVDLLREKVGWIYPVYFTHGDRRSEDDLSSGREIKLGKAYLVSRLQTLLQTHRIHLPKTAESDVLAKELQDYEIRVDENANDKYGAFRVGTHDDLVTALGLAVQKDPIFYNDRPLELPDDLKRPGADFDERIKGVY